MAYLQGFGAEGDHLRSRFYTQWKAARSYTDPQMDTHVAWGNVKFTPPSGDLWVRFTVTHSGADRMTPGTSPLRRHDAQVQIEVFAPENSGEGTIDDYCDDAADIFRDYTSQQGLRIRTPYTVNVGVVDGWYKKDVLIPFVRDVIHS